MAGRSKQRTGGSAEESLTRREILKRGAGAAVGAPLLAAEVQTRRPARKAPVARASKTTKFFTEAEFELVDELSEMIIPDDDHSPGARAAKVAEYIDGRLAESFENGPPEQWRAGLQLVDRLALETSGRIFMLATVAQRHTVLGRMSQNETNPQRDEEKFFRELKSRVADAYYSSRIGIHDEMEYKGNMFLREFVGEDAV